MKKHVKRPTQNAVQARRRNLEIGELLQVYGGLPVKENGTKDGDWK
jgi:hypothetical protein